MSRYKVLRLWAMVLVVVGFIGLFFALVAAVVGAFAADGFWEGIAALFVGLTLGLFVATWPIALGEALKALANIGDKLDGLEPI